MEKFKGLKVPPHIHQEGTYLGKWNVFCKNANCEEYKCAECIFDLKNTEAFKEWCASKTDNRIEFSKEERAVVYKALMIHSSRLKGDAEFCSRNQSVGVEDLKKESDLCSKIAERIKVCLNGK